MKNVSVQIMSAVDTASATGPAQDCNQWVYASFQTMTGDAAAVGVVKIQGSNDSPTTSRSLFQPTNWSDIPSATASVTAGVAPMIVISTMTYQYIRAVYTRTSGGSTIITVQANGQMP